MADAETVAFQFDYAELGVFLRTSPELRAYLEDLGRNGVAYARSIAPVGTRTTKYTEPGQYRDSIRYEITTGTTRMSLRIFSDDYTAWWMEYGSKKTPKYAVLRRALDYLRTGQAQQPSAYPGIASYDAANTGTQLKRATRRRRRAAGR